MAHCCLMCGHDGMDWLPYDGMLTCQKCGHVQLYGEPVAKLVTEGELDLSKPVKYYSGVTITEAKDK